MLTTSFPLTRNATSGVFVARLAAQLGKLVELVVLTPDVAYVVSEQPVTAYESRRFRYAPRQWQQLAHGPGGIMASLHGNLWRWGLLPGFLLAMLYACVRLARSCDLLHANWAINGAVAGLAGAICGKPVVTTLRGSDVTGLESSRFARAAVRLCLSTNRRLVCVGESVRQQVLKYFPAAASKLSVIENGVDDEFLFLGRARTAAAGTELRLISVGNLIPSKAMHVLIEAMKRVQKTNVHISLTIVGDGVEQDRLLGMIRSLNLEDRVRLSGKLPPDQVAAQLAAADAFVFASEREGRPNAVIEAMAAGLPVIASRIPGITDLIEDGSSGLLFDTGDANKLATHIAMIAEDAELRLRVGNAAHRAIVDRGLNWESTARRYVELYAAVVHETGQRAA